MQKSTPEPRDRGSLSLAAGGTEQMCRGTSAKRGRAVEQGRNRVRAAIIPSGPAWKRGHEWELHGTHLRLQGMAHLPGVKAGGPNCCLPGLCRQQLLPRDISRMVTQQCCVVWGGKSLFGVFRHRNLCSVWNCLSNWVSQSSPPQKADGKRVVWDLKLRSET